MKNFPLSNDYEYLISEFCKWRREVCIIVSFKIGHLMALRVILFGSIIIEVHYCLRIEKLEIVEQHLSRRHRVDGERSCSSSWTKTFWLTTDCERRIYFDFETKQFSKPSRLFSISILRQYSHHPPPTPIAEQKNLPDKNTIISNPLTRIHSLQEAVKEKIHHPFPPFIHFIHHSTSTKIYQRQGLRLFIFSFDEYCFYKPSSWFSNIHQHAHSARWTSSNLYPRFIRSSLRRWNWFYIDYQRLIHFRNTNKYV